MFILQMNGARDALRVMVSSGIEQVPWEHVSVSVRDRCPIWGEMVWVKDQFFDETESVVQYHPPKTEYVNVHPHCLHLWKPTVAVLPLPPWFAVGTRTDADIPALQAIREEILSKRQP